MPLSAIGTSAGAHRYAKKRNPARRATADAMTPAVAACVESLYRVWQLQAVMPPGPCERRSGRVACRPPARAAGGTRARAATTIRRYRAYLAEASGGRVRDEDWGRRQRNPIASDLPRPPPREVTPAGLRPSPDRYGGAAAGQHRAWLPWASLVTGESVASRGTGESVGRTGLTSAGPTRPDPEGSRRGRGAPFSSLTSTPSAVPSVPSMNAARALSISRTARPAGVSASIGARRVVVASYLRRHEALGSDQSSASRCRDVLSVQSHAAAAALRPVALSFASAPNVLGKPIAACVQHEHDVHGGSAPTCTGPDL